MRTVRNAVLSTLLVLAGCSDQNLGGPHSASSLASGIGSAPVHAAREGAIVDPNQGGTADALRIRSVRWGRLAEIYDLDPGTGAARLQARDVLVGEDAGRSVAVDDVAVAVQPILGTLRVTIRRARGSNEYAAALARLEAGAIAIAEKGVGAAELPPFTMVPRDAVIEVAFDDLLDPASITSESVRVSVRDARSPARELCARVFADPNHGGFVERNGAVGFYPTRILVATRIAELDARASGEALAANELGLPAATSAGVANCALRFPTAIDAASGCVARLLNLGGHGLSARENGPTDAASPGRDVVRAFRSGGATAATGDPYDGFLAPQVGPQVVGDQDASIDAVSPDPLGGSGDFVIGVTFAVAACAHAARIGDVVEQPDGAAVEVVAPSAPPSGGSLTHVRVHSVGANPPLAGVAQYRTLYDPVADAGSEACFVRIRPAPSAPPSTGVSPDAELALRFNQPMDPASVTALSSWTLTRVASGAHPSQLVPCNVRRGDGPDEFRTHPSVPLDHVVGTSESYFVNLAGGSTGVKSAAGLPLAVAFPQVHFTLDATAPTASTGGYALTFASQDEDGNGKPEIRGQFLYDFANGIIRPRPVMHFAAIADRTQPVPGIMTPLSAGVQTPLVALGSRMQSVWRYCDVGMALLDESGFNVDVEGLDWAPIGGGVIADHFTQFEISLAHAGFLPDEARNLTTLFPQFPHSGLVDAFARNELDHAHDPLAVVHPRALGYTINPADKFTASTGTVMMPYPLNRTIPPSQFKYYTWRDTALQAKGAPNGAGAELAIVTQVQGGTPGVPYAPGAVPTVGLPLLMDFKCFPDSSALGLNALDVSVAINTSPHPNLRAFSSGGVDSSGAVHVVDPDAATIATGGFNRASSPPGAPTLPSDDTFYLGEMDLVVRVSRVHTVWFDAQASATFAAPLIEPTAGNQPAGTHVSVASRGALLVSAALQSDATALDAYGDAAGGGHAVAFLNGDNTWKGDVGSIAGARFVQLRATFVSDAPSGLVPTLSGLGIAFTRP